MFPVKLIEFLDENQVNTICWVVSALSIIVSENGDMKIPKFIHTVAFGGEKNITESTCQVDECIAKQGFSIYTDLQKLRVCQCIAKWSVHSTLKVCCMWVGHLKTRMFWLI